MKKEDIKYILIWLNIDPNAEPSPTLNFFNTEASLEEAIAHCLYSKYNNTGGLKVAVFDDIGNEHYLSANYLIIYNHQSKFYPKRPTKEIMNTITMFFGGDKETILWERNKEYLHSLALLSNNELN